MILMLTYIAIITGLGLSSIWVEVRRIRKLLESSHSAGAPTNAE